MLAMEKLTKLAVAGNALYAMYWTYDIGRVRRGLAMMFTMWTIVTHCLHGILGLIGAPRKIQEVTATLALFCAVVTTIVFWAIYYVDPHLIFDPRVPSMLNHMLHSTILPLLVVDLIAMGTPGTSLAGAVSWSSGITIVYGAFLLYVNVHYGMWPYRFMHSWSVTDFSRMFLIAIPVTVALATFLYALRQFFGKIRGTKEEHLKTH